MWPGRALFRRVLAALSDAAFLMAAGDWPHAVARVAKGLFKVFPSTCEAWCAVAKRRRAIEATCSSTICFQGGRRVCPFCAIFPPMGRVGPHGLQCHGGCGPRGQHPCRGARPASRGATGVGASGLAGASARSHPGPDASSPCQPDPRTDAGTATGPISLRDTARTCTPATCARLKQLAAFAPAAGRSHWHAGALTRSAVAC